MVVVVVGFGFYLSRQPPPTPTSIPDTAESPPVSPPLTTEEATDTTPSPPLREQASQQNVDIESTTVPAVPELPPVALPTVAEQPKPVKPKTPSVSTSTGPLLMELEATQLTWVVVKSDGKEPEEALLQPKQRTTWKAKKQFTLTLGNAGGVRVWVNGESRGPFGKQGQIVREVVIRD